MFEILSGFNNQGSTGASYWGAAIISILVIVVFLICREIMCWYWKINKMIRLMEEANADRKEIIKLLMNKHDSEVNTKQ